MQEYFAKCRRRISCLTIKSDELENAGKKFAFYLISHLLKCCRLHEPESGRTNTTHTAHTPHTYRHTDRQADRQTLAWPIHRASSNNAHTNCIEST